MVERDQHALYPFTIGKGTSPRCTRGHSTEDLACLLGRRMTQRPAPNPRPRPCPTPPAPRGGNTYSLGDPDPGGASRWTTTRGPQHGPPGPREEGSVLMKWSTWSLVTLAARGMPSLPSNHYLTRDPVHGAAWCPGRAPRGAPPGGQTIKCVPLVCGSGG